MKLTKEAATKGVLKNFAIFTAKHLSQGLFFKFIKEPSAKVFSCEYCEIFKNTYLEEQLRTTITVTNHYEGWTCLRAVSGKLIIISQKIGGTY